MTYLSCTSVAGHLRVLLKKKYPDVKWSVRTRHSSALMIAWTDGPSVDEVLELASPLKGRTWNSATETWSGNETTTIRVKGSVERTGKSMIQYVNCDRAFSQEVKDAALAKYLDHHGKALEELETQFQDAATIDGIQIQPGHAEAQVRQICDGLVLAARQPQS